ncbi:MAG: SLBB domain-containing protein [Chitinispirillaceae bacterium]|nr:SLBB domain-containing protein [Chitinispirillaceae bacterium]
MNNLPFFGYAIFNKTPDAFKPNAFGPVDPGYLVGPGDIMRLSVWGEVEFQYELKVNRDGKIFIPVAGQLYVTGIPFEKLQSKIQSILSKHYSGLASTPQKSFLDLSIAQIHPIRIFMMGEVKAPGGYTVSTSSTAFNAFYSISGPLTSGSLRDISIIRDQKEIAKLDLYEYFTTGKCTTDVRLLNDDVVFTPRRGKTVAITGSVFRPAIYELKESEKLISLLTYCGGILPQSNGGRALIKRVVPIKDRTADNPVRKVLDVDLQKLLIDSVDVDLCDKDTIEISPLSDELKNFATISGAVHYPGMYQVENLSLYTLIFSLGKPIETKAFTGRADLIRRNEDKVSFTTLPIDLKQLLADSATQDQFLQPFDEVIIYEKQVEKPIDLLITIDGEVRNPGSYTLSSNQTVIDALLRAGGFTREAYRNIVNVFRLHLSKNGSDTITETFNISLPDSIDFNAPRDNQFTLHDRDKIVVRPNADYITDNYVTIEGLVKFRGKYAIKVRGERLSDLIFRAGGLLPDAFLEGATVTRNKQRVVVNFAEALSGQSSKENLLLQKNDIITIPPRPNTVLVSGNVNNPGLFSYVENSKVRTYIDRAGGLADSSTVILLTSPGGETAKVRKISFKNPMVKDGSTIFVLKKRPRDLSKEKQGPTVTEVIRDTLAIMASAFTVIGLAIQMRK